MNHYDVIIIGGGPAGSIAAIQSAIMGLTVAIIESDSEPKERPGEILPPGIDALLRKLDMLTEFNSFGFLRHEGIHIQWDNTMYFRPYNTDKVWEGYQIWRPQFDSMLLKKATDLGVNIIRQSKALQPIFENGRITGIKTNKESLYCSTLVDAGGSKHWLAHRLKIPVEKHSPQLIAQFGYIKNKDWTVNDSPTLIANNEGWTWTAKISSDLFQWIKLNFHKYNNSTPSKFFNLPVNYDIRKADVTWRMVSEPAGSGYFIVGDAAFVLDPSSSHGMLKAIMSGMMAAHMIRKIHNNSSLEKQAIGEYSNWIKQWFLHDVKKLKELYRKHPNPPKWILKDSTIHIPN